MMKADRASTTRQRLSRALLALALAFGFAGVARADILIGWGSYIPGADLIEETQFMCTQPGSSCSDSAIGSVRLTVSRAIVPPNPDIARCHVQSIPGKTSTRRVISVGGIPASSVYVYYFTLNCPIAEEAANPRFDYWAKLGGTWYFAGSVGTLQPSYSGPHELFGTGTTLNGTPLSTALSLPEELRVCLSPGSPLNGGCEAATTGGPGPVTPLATLTVQKAGTGSGTVTGPAGLNCGPTCAASYSTDLTVTLTAAASSGSTLAGWSGDCAGASANASVSMSVNRTCIATFNRIPTGPTTPGAPTITGVSASAGAITMTFTAPSSNGGSPILDYTVTCGTRSATGASSPITVTGLAAGTYTCLLRARNAVGLGASQTSSAVTVPGSAGPSVPGAPTIAAVSPSAGAITVTFNVPSSNGGSPILDYTATCGTRSSTRASSPITVTGLTPGTYTCRVTARNAVGSGAASPASSPATVTASSTPSSVTLSVTFSGNSSTGRVTSSPSGIDCRSGGTGVCSASFPFGTIVRLFSSAGFTTSITSAMDGWTGDCHGGPEAAILMSASKNCVAHFNQAPGNYLVNGNFESGSSGWSQVAPRGGAIVTNATTSTGQSYSFLGPWYADFGASGSGDYALFQDVDIPVGRATHLQFWYDATEYEYAGFGAGPSSLQVIVEGPAGSRTLATIYDADGGTDWTPTSPYDLSDFAGQRVRIRFQAKIEFAGSFGAVARFRLDEVRLTSRPRQTTAENHTGLWWNPAESGWGINLNHQGNTMFATLFTYDSARRPMWLVMSNGSKVDDITFRGDLYTITGPAFNAVPFTPVSAANVTRVGTMTVRFAAGGATLNYSVNGVAVSKTITRQVFGGRAGRCVIPTLRGGTSSTTALWWNPDESGWGINLTQQGEQLFATLFTYGQDGRPVWYVMSGGSRRPGQSRDGAYEGELYEVSGPPFNASPFTPIGPGNLRQVGTMKISDARYHPADQMTLTYSVNGVSVTKKIVRQVFEGLPAVCGI